MMEFVRLNEIASNDVKPFAMGPFGSNIKSENYIDDPVNGVPVIRGINLKGEKLDISNLVFLSQDKANSLKNSYAFPNDIVFAAQGNVGSVGIIPEETPYPLYVLSQNLMKVAIDKNIADPLFVYFYFTSRQGQYEIRKYVNTTGVPCISQPLSSLKSFEIPSFSQAEQRKISSILSAFDDKISVLRRQNETLEEMAQAIYRHWFVDFEFPDENGKPYKSSGGKLVPSELGDIPEGWRVGTLGDEIDAIRGLSYKGVGLADEGTPMHNLKSVFEGGGYQYSGIKYYKETFKDRHQCKAGDIIVPNTEQGERHKLIGFPARIPKTFGINSIFTHHLFKLEIKDESYISNHYLYYLFMAPYVRRQILGYTNGTTVNMLSKDAFVFSKFIRPPEKVIREFSTLVELVWDKSETNIVEIETLTNLRNILLPKLMSGVLRIPG